MSSFIKMVDKYGLTKLIGEGRSGKVYKAINTQTKEQVAVKVIETSKYEENPQLNEYSRSEIDILSELKHAPHIVEYLDLFRTTNNYYFIYEYCNGGTLKSQIMEYKNKSAKVMPLSKAITYFGEILVAFKALTKNKIMHRDLKPDNILLHNGKIKIADFGFSKLLKSPTDLAETMLGSPIYMAPEVLYGDPYTMKADIWSLGVVLYEMVYGTCPFESKQIAKLIQILQQEDVRYPKTIPQAVQNILRKMLVKEPSKRISWVELFEYKVTQTGQLIEPIKIVKTMSSGIVSGGRNYQSTMRHLESNTESHQTAKSPIPHQREKIYNFQKNEGKNTLTTTSKDQQNQLKQLTNNHEKVLLAIKLSMQVLKRSPKQSFALSFIINKAVYKELNTILQFLNKEWLSESSHSDKSHHGSVMRFKEIVIDELIQLDSSLKNFKGVVQSLQGDVNMIELKKNKYLRSFYQSYRSKLQEDGEAIILISQMIDYFEESIVLKMESYKRIDKYELLRQVQSRINKLL